MCPSTSTSPIFIHAPTRYNSSRRLSRIVNIHTAAMINSSLFVLIKFIIISSISFTLYPLIRNYRKAYPGTLHSSDTAAARYTGDVPYTSRCIGIKLKFCLCLISLCLFSVLRRRALLMRLYVCRAPQEATSRKISHICSCYIWYIAPSYSSERLLMHTINILRQTKPRTVDMSHVVQTGLMLKYSINVIISTLFFSSSAKTTHYKE